jgi:hypothetical protein
MPREQIQDLIETKKNYQNNLIEVLKKYYMKFIERTYQKSLREFQEKLFKIPNWSDEKLDKEYSKFLKFIHEKYDLDEDEFTKILNIVYCLNIKIMTSICHNLEVNSPKLKKFWYRCLKHIAKYYYEHPKVMLLESDFKKTKIQVEESINNILQKFIPLNEIINATKNPPQDKYNFDNGLGDTDNSSPIYNDSKPQLEVTLASETESNDLKYLLSNEFDNEYYVSDKEDNVKKGNEKSDEKHIKLPKYVFPNKKLYKNSKGFKHKYNELDENFFDDI